jgi:hypothetical protein
MMRRSVIKNIHIVAVLQNLAFYGISKRIKPTTMTHASRLSIPEWLAHQPLDSGVRRLFLNAFLFLNKGYLYEYCIQAGYDQTHHRGASSKPQKNFSRSEHPYN